VLAVFVTPASASVTLGQLATTPSGSSTGTDFAQLSVSSGTSYQVLNAKGKVSLSLAITYTPANGDPATQSVNLKLRRSSRG
jgi:hypothetical protein